MLSYQNGSGYRQQNVDGCVVSQVHVKNHTQDLDHVDQSLKKCFAQAMLIPRCE